MINHRFLRTNAFWLCMPIVTEHGLYCINIDVASGRVFLRASILSMLFNHLSLVTIERNSLKTLIDLKLFILICFQLEDLSMF